MNLKEYASPLFLINVGVIAVIFVCMTMVMYVECERHATAIETCHQFIDKNDFKTKIVRTENDINVVEVYNVYDVCKDRSGNITSNRSLGYMTYPRYLLVSNRVW